MQAHVFWKFLSQKLYFYPLAFEIESKKKFPLLLPSHNCIIITMFSFQGASESLLLRDSMKLQITLEFQSISLSYILRSGGPKWTRTIDLTIISRVL